MPFFRRHSSLAAKPRARAPGFVVEVPVAPVVAVATDSLVLEDELFEEPPHPVSRAIITATSTTKQTRNRISNPPPFET
jgi:hypothetical protein